MFTINYNKNSNKNQEAFFLLILKDLKFISLLFFSFIMIFIISNIIERFKIINYIPIKRLFDFIFFIVFLIIIYNFIQYLLFLKDKTKILKIIDELEKIRNNFYFSIIKEKYNINLEETEKNIKLDPNLKENNIIKRLINNLNEKEIEKVEIISASEDEEIEIEEENVEDKKEKKSKDKKIKKVSKIEEHLKKPKELKILQAIFIDLMIKLNEKTLNVKNINVGRLLLCANFLLFLKSNSGHYKLRRANLCGNRFCPICSWVEAKRNAFKILELIMYIREIEKKELVFMTLTVPNCKGEDLTVTIDKLNKSFKRLMETKRFKNICLGYIRKLEVTYNEEANTYHPHFHIIMAVNKSYFTSRDYLKILDLLELWRKATKDNSITQVDLKKVRMGSIKEVMEIATYTTKMKDLYKNEEVFIILYGALRGRQIITYNGIFKDLCKLQEEKKLDVSNIKQLTDIQEKATKEVSYKWKKEEKEYEEYYVRELAEDEIEKFYNLNIDKIIN